LPGEVHAIAGLDNIAQHDRIDEFRRQSGTANCRPDCVGTQYAGCSVFEGSVEAADCSAYRRADDDVFTHEFFL
jgi:hypothetical protein